MGLWSCDCERVRLYKWEHEKVFLWCVVMFVHVCVSTFTVMGVMKIFLCVSVSVKIMRYATLFVCACVNMHAIEERVYCNVSRWAWVRAYIKLFVNMNIIVKLLTIMWMYACVCLFYSTRKAYISRENRKLLLNIIFESNKSIYIKIRYSFSVARNILANQVWVV